jgi:SulP family sulfate permease
MSGIGIILILLQLPPLLGQPTQPGGALGTISALPELLAEINPTASLLGLATLLLLLLTPKRFSKHLPPQLIALILGTGVAFLWLGNSGLTTVGEISLGLPAIVLPTFTPEMLTTMVVDALLLAILGCIDTLLTAVIADSLTRKDHDSNKELIGQGLGNMFSGFCGGLPGAGATMGTVVNIQSGGRTPMAGALRVLILAVIIFGAAELTEHIPLAVLAAIAIKVGLDILDWSFLKRAHRINLPTTMIMYGVMLMTVFIDLMVAVGVGVFVANVLTIEKLSQVQARKVRAVRAISDADDEVPLDEEEQRLLEGADGRILLFYLTGPMIFGVTKAISRQHAEVKDYEVMVLDLSSVSMLDTTIALALENAIVESTESGCSVYLVSEDEDVIDQLASLGLFNVIGRDAVVARRIDALHLATEKLETPTNQGVFNLPVRAKAASA